MHGFAREKRTNSLHHSNWTKVKWLSIHFCIRFSLTSSHRKAFTSAIFSVLQTVKYGFVFELRLEFAYIKFNRFSPSLLQICYHPARIHSPLSACKLFLVCIRYRGSHNNRNGSRYAAIDWILILFMLIEWKAKHMDLK